MHRKQGRTIPSPAVIGRVSSAPQPSIPTVRLRKHATISLRAFAMQLVHHEPQPFGPELEGRICGPVP